MPASADLAEAAALLGHPDPARADQAAEALKGAGTAALSLVLQTAEHGPWEARLRAVRLLAHLAEERSLAALAAMLRDPDLGLRRAVAAALPAAGPAVLPLLVEALRHWDWDVRSRAAEALGLLGRSEAAPALIQALRDAREPVRLHAARALGCLAEPADTGPLLEALGDPAASVVGAAAASLARVGDAGTVPFLLPHLSHPERRVREVVAGVLTVLEWQPQSREEEIRLALAAGDFSGAECRAAIPALCLLLRDDDWEVRRQSAQTLARIAERDPVPQLRAALPILRALLGPWPNSGEEPHRSYREALTRVEAATATVRDLPVSSTHMAPPARHLPAPAVETPADPPPSSRPTIGAVPELWRAAWKSLLRR